jgi:hypothetical protein
MIASNVSLFVAGLAASPAFFIDARSMITTP